MDTDKQPPSENADLTARTAQAWANAPVLRPEGEARVADRPRARARNLWLWIGMSALIAGPALLAVFGGFMRSAPPATPVERPVAPATTSASPQPPPNGKAAAPAPDKATPLPPRSPVPAVATGTATKSGKKTSDGRNNVQWIATVTPPTTGPAAVDAATPDAIEVGIGNVGRSAGRKQFVCRVEEEDGNVYPGNLMGGRCYYAWRGHGRLSNRFEAASYRGGSWKKATPAGALLGGREENGSTYVCRASVVLTMESSPPASVRWFASMGNAPQAVRRVESGMLGGKFVPARNACLVAFLGREFAAPDRYELFYPH